jgi:hypothetical protein
LPVVRTLHEPESSEDCCFISSATMRDFASVQD